MKRFLIVCILVLIPLLSAIFLNGCLPTRGLKEVKIVKHPDAPMLIIEVSGTRVLVAIYDKENNKMIEYGWVNIPEGWTLSKYDWEKFLTRNQ